MELAQRRKPEGMMLSMRPFQPARPPSRLSAEDFATVAKDIEGDEEGEAETEHAEELTDDAFGEGEASEEGDKSCAAGGDPGAGGYAAEGLDDRVRIWNVDGHGAGA